MKLHSLEHAPFEGLGAIEPWAASRGHRITTTRFYHHGPLPKLEDVDLLVVMGGPMNVYEEKQYPWLADEKRFIERAIKGGKRVIGVCLGAQLIADVLGAKVYPNREKEIGWFPVQKTEEAARSPLFEQFLSELTAFHWHGDTFDLPSGAIHTVRSATCEQQAFVFEERVVGLQFHLEMTKESATELIAHCKDELVDRPFIQTAKAMLAEEAPFQKINRTMSLLLDRLQEPLD